MKKINKFLIENKKVMLFAPIILVALITLVYFNLGDNKKTVAQRQLNADTSLPEANTTEVPDDKLQTFKEFDDYSTGQTKERSKGMDMDIESTENLTLGKKNEDVVYEQPSADLSAKLDAMITKMDESKKKKSTSNSSVYRESVQKNTVTKPAVETETATEKFKRESKENFDDFFVKKQPSSLNSSQSSDEKLYAVVYKDQIIKNQDRVTLILTKDAIIKGKLYKANSMIYAIANFSQNRVNLNITNVNQEKIKLIAYDAQDSNQGIYIEGESLVKEVASDLEDAQVNDLDLNGVPLGNAVKRIFTRKKREPKVQLLNNYKLILKLEK